MAVSKTLLAVRRVQAGEKVLDVAHDLKISPAAIYARKKREEGMARCPCCGQVVKEGFKIDRSVLKAGAGR